MTVSAMAAAGTPTTTNTTAATAAITNADAIRSNMRRLWRSYVDQRLFA